MTDEKIIKELESIKNLLVLMLIKSGSTSEEISSATEEDSSTIRKKFPIRKIKKEKKED